MRNTKTWTFAVAAALAVAAAPGIARAEDDPLRAGLTKGMTREQLVAHDKKLFEDYKRQQDEQQRTTTGAGLWLQRAQQITVKPHDVEMRVERYVDGAILYSMALEPKELEAIGRFGQFRKVERKEEVTDRVVFQGRVYRTMRAVGTPSDWERAVGHDAVVTMQTRGGMQQALSVRVKK